MRLPIVTETHLWIMPTKANAEGKITTMRNFTKGILIPILVLLMMVAIATTDNAVANVVSENNVVTVMMP